MASQPAPPSPSSSPASQCPHLSPLLTPLGIRRLSLAAEFLFSAAYRPCIGIASSLVPRCMHSNACPQPTTHQVCVCVQCVFVACHHHLRAACGHKIFLSVEFQRLFCVACQDFVHNVFMDAAIDLQKEIAISDKRSFLGSESWIDVPKLNLNEGLMGGISKKLKNRIRKVSVVRGKGKKGRAYMATSWVPTEKELELIRAHCLGRVHRLASKAKPVGLFNLGNSCYMNSVLQAFLNAPPLRCFFLADGHRPTCKHEPKSDCLACAFDELVCDSITEELGLEAHADSGEAGAQDKEKKAEKSHKRWFLIPQRVLDIVWHYADNLATYGQHDAHEFLITALNILNAHMRVGGATGSNPATPNSRSIPLSPVCNARIGSQTGAPSTFSSKQAPPSIVQSFFSGILQSDVICRKCANSSSTQEKFYDISLDVDKFILPDVKAKTRGSSPDPANADAAVDETEPVDSNGQSDQQNTASQSRSPTPGTGTDRASPEASCPANSVTDCLARFTEPELLGAGSKLFCPVCRSSQEAMKQMSIRTLPPVLCLHFKRFEQTFAKIRRSEMVKIENPVEFPTDGLDLRPFTTSAVLRKRLKLGPDADTNTVNAILTASEEIPGMASIPTSKINSGEEGLYDLFAVVNHSGKIDRGHYTTLVRRRGHWFKCDDEKVTRTTKVGKSIKSEHAYLLFYVQRSPYFQH